MGQLGDGGTPNADKSTPVAVSNATGIVAIAAGGDNTGSYSLALKSDGTVLSWGNDKYGQLGNGNGAGNIENKSEPVSVSLGVGDLIRTP